MIENMHGVYRDERVTFELGPQWFTVPIVQSLQRINPTEEELDALAEEKGRGVCVSEKVELLWIAVQEEDENDENDRFFAAIVAEIPWEPGRRVYRSPWVVGGGK